MTLQMSLLEVLAYKMNCLYLSDLQFLSAAQKIWLIREIEAIPPQAASVPEWNEALDYLAGAGPEETEAVAKERLMAALLGEEHREKAGKFA